jgi:hypothetical protein
MTRYKMTVVFDAHEQIVLKYVHREKLDNDIVTLASEPVKRSENAAIMTKEQPHINRLYEDIIESNRDVT